MAYSGSGPTGRATNLGRIRQPRLPDRLQSGRPNNEGARKSKADT